jgi:hypothetical protein
MQECFKLKDRNPTQIASFLVRKYNSEKVKAMIEEFEAWGFTKESLVEDRGNLFKFLVLVAYDRQPFDRPDYYAVWDKDNRNSVCSVLEQAELLNIDKVRNLSEKEIELLLRKCVAHGYHLHNSNPKSERMGTNFAKTIKKISETTDDLMHALPRVQNSTDTLRLHRKLCTIHGIKETIAAKFIMYTVRELGIGNVSPSQLEPIAFYLFGEWHNQKWAKRLENPVLGGRNGLVEQVMEQLKEDPIAVDFFWQLDREFCTKGKCQECEL